MVSERDGQSARPSVFLRVVNIVLCLLMLLFIAVQYNDPDGLMWMAIYLVPAVWALLAAINPFAIGQGLLKTLLLLTIVASLAAMFYYWPKTSGWWKQEVWWEVETAREGMGMMIVSVVLLVALFSGMRAVRARLTNSSV
jgi:hypothetical protein